MAHRVIDMRGEDCPGPLVKAIREAAKAPVGSVIQVLTDSERCVDLLKDMVSDLGLGKVSVDDKGDYMVVTIRRLTVVV